MRLLVLGAFWPEIQAGLSSILDRVLMRLLVLGAFWLGITRIEEGGRSGLNAPSGAG